MDAIILTSKADLFFRLAFYCIVGVAIIEFGLKNNFHRLSLGVVFVITLAAGFAAIILPFM